VTELDLAELRQLYFDGTKHSVYQNVPAFVRDAIGLQTHLDEKWRGDTARMENLLAAVNFQRVHSLADIGANIGFFALTLAHSHSHLQVTAYEANAHYCRFMQVITEAFGLSRVSVKNATIDLQGISTVLPCDLALLFNVLHHAGVDFDRGRVTPETFHSYATKYLSRLRSRCRRLVLQMGFNWGGDKQQPLIPLEDDAGKIVFLARMCREAGWTIRSVFTMARRGKWSYAPLPDALVNTLNGASVQMYSEIRNFTDSLELSEYSEFYRRPVFFCAAGNEELA